MQDSINENPAYLKLFTGNLHRRFPLSFTTLPFREPMSWLFETLRYFYICASKLGVCYFGATR